MIDDGEKREPVERGRYLARTIDLTDRHAHALALRELGYTHAPIADELDELLGRWCE